MRNIVNGTAIDERRLCRGSPVDRHTRVFRSCRRVIVGFAALLAVAAAPASAHGA